MRYVIIGNSAAAVGAVEGIRRVDEENPITLISDEPYHTYSRPLISYYLAGKVTEGQMLYRQQDFYEKNKVEAMLGRRAAGIDVEGREVRLADGFCVPYDRLLIATGGKPFVPPLEGLDKENVFTFLKLGDVKKIKEVAAAGSRVVIIGAGLIGLKAAEALALMDVEITVVELANRVLSAILDEEAAGIVQGQMETRGIKFEMETTVERVLGEEKVTGAVLKNGKQVPCDFLVVAIGVVPNTEVAQGTPIKVNRGIVVDERMQTSVTGIYAAGDVSEGFDTVYGAHRVLPILPNAYRQGETAGMNMAGSAASYPGGFAMNSIGFFGLPMTTAGIIKPETPGFEVLVNSEPENQSYKKVVLKDNMVVGFISLNKIDRSGILTGLIRDRVDVERFKNYLVADDFGYLHFPPELRKARLLEGGLA
ncbi:pyridine nucleotide-disulfide oxidoreductase [Clostridiales bacterium PH28_bin88]|nr:pyridine nucleotide-disulfide oxidoreductase [Clostridiales bacterium PH28_bin88]